MTLIEQLSTTNGFIKRYIEHLDKSATQAEAYDKTEQDFERIFKRRRYACFDSFRQVKNRIAKRKQLNNNARR
jgi:hypothetical protein